MEGGVSPLLKDVKGKSRDFHLAGGKCRRGAADLRWAWVAWNQAKQVNKWVSQGVKDSLVFDVPKSPTICESSDIPNRCTPQKQCVYSNSGWFIPGFTSKCCFNYSLPNKISTQDVFPTSSNGNNLNMVIERQERGPSQKETVVLRVTYFFVVVYSLNTDE